MISEVNEIKTSVNAFKLQYDGNIPGDFKYAVDYWSGSSNGNGNGKIEIDVGSSPNFENVLTFEHLGLAELTKVSYSASTAPYLTTALMSTSFNQTAGYMMYSIPVSSSTYDSYEGFYSNAFEQGLILKVAQDRSSVFDGAFISGLEASKIDKKYDDSIASSGDVRTNIGVKGISGAYTLQQCTNITNLSSATNWASTSAEYDKSLDDPNCMMFFFIERENI
jgi:hypothetical protein